MPKSLSRKTSSKGRSQKHIKSILTKESMTNARDSFRKLKPSDPQHHHEVLIAITQRNLDQLHDTLMDRGTPGHPLYQQWLTFEQIGDLVRNEAALAAVESWLKSEAIEVTWRSPRGEYVKVRARIEEWERVLSTRFYEWHDTADGTASLHHRSESYSVPSDVSGHISAIFNTCQVPPLYQRMYHSQSMPSNATFASSTSRGSCTASSPCLTSVPFINSLYGITSNAGNSTLSQAVFETQNEGFSQKDLSTFQTTFNLPVQQAKVVGTKPSTNCTGSTCGEGSLDIQYLMGLAHGSESVFWYTDADGDDFLNFLVAVASAPSPPTSLSISWGANEASFTSAALHAFNAEAMKLTAMGVTIFAAVGDTGVSGTGCACSSDTSSTTPRANTWSGNNSWTGQGYFPIYPASCPYVVAVGASQGPEYGGPEVVCQASTEKISVTTGGGFSSFFPRPIYQQETVSNYLSSSAGQASSPGYNAMGRGYPDISFIGNLFPVYIGGETFTFSGSSASAPVAAALITLVNTQRLARGLSTVGFINPTLYANAGKFNDITSGSNNCCQRKPASPVAPCCASGFSAAPGWDPASGLGSITFDNLVKILVPPLNGTATTVRSGSSTFFFATGTGLAVVGAVGGCLLLVALLLYRRLRRPSAEYDTSDTFPKETEDEPIDTKTSESPSAKARARARMQDSAKDSEMRSMSLKSSLSRVELTPERFLSLSSERYVSLSVEREYPEVGSDSPRLVGISRTDSENVFGERW